MRKFQAMMAVVLMALMTFAVQSCGNDDKDDNLGTVMYKMSRSLVFSDKGELTTEAAESFQKKYRSEETAEFLTDKQAESSTDQIASKLASSTKAELDGMSAKFTITIITTNLSNNKQVCKWEIYYDNGSVSSKKF
jgi:hypothetical protein